MRALRSRLALPFLMLVLMVTACGPLPGGSPTSSPATQETDIGKIVEATLTAVAAQATPSQATATQPPSTPAPGAAKGSISGRLSYPADTLPAMYVVAYRTDAENYRYIITNAGQGTYRIDDLPAGMYHVIAYTVGGGGFPAGFAGGYTQAVICGLATECANHSLVDVEVAAGEDVSGINVLDWYAPMGTFQPFPGQPATQTPGSSYGSIAGTLTYPADRLPPMRIVAFEIGSDSYFFTETDGSQSNYRIENLPAGTYHVVAYVIPGDGFPPGMAGGYTQVVPCGYQADCNDHTLIDVVVTGGSVTTEVNPGDFYAPPGSFPPDPAP